MPNNPVHSWWSERATGMKCEKTHRLIDSFSSIKGKQHRQWLHTPIEAATVALVSEGPECIPAALNHLYIDQLYNTPQTKIAMEMIRLSQKPSKEAPDTQNGCWIQDKP